MTHEELRRRMVEEQLKARGITDARVLAAFLRVPRHAFVPPDRREEAYTDRPLPIGHDQTISQPYMVALMVEALRLQGHERVLELGSGSGYQLAILAELALEVYSIERIPGLAELAERRLRGLGYVNVHVSAGNGTLGWPESAPYDAVIVSAAAPEAPASLIEQLSDPGRLIIPIGPPQTQTLTLIQKREGQLQSRAIAQCVFVPLIGAQGWPEGSDG
jgi:protein-L-isoaspartate(D-aspartate) O-methyltransferase